MFPSQNAGPAESFPSTPWSLLTAITRPANASPGEEAFISTFEICWRPICNFIRAHGYEERDAREIARGFLASLIAHRRSDPSGVARLPMRVYVREALKQFLAAETARRNARRRNFMAE